MRTEDVWIKYPDDFDKGLLNKTSLVDTSPFIPYFTSVLSDERFQDGFKRNFTIGAVDIGSGKFTTFTRDNINFGEELATAALCSSSIPMVFPPTHFKGNSFVDGGTVWDVNISSAVEGCLSQVDGDESKITVDILICGDPHLNPHETTKHTVENYLRGRHIHMYYSNMNAVQEQMRAYPKVNWRYLIEESGVKPDMDLIRMDPDVTWPL